MSSQGQGQGGPPWNPPHGAQPQQPPNWQRTPSGQPPHQSHPPLQYQVQGGPPQPPGAQFTPGNGRPKLPTSTIVGIITLTLLSLVLVVMLMIAQPWKPRVTAPPPVPMSSATAEPELEPEPEPEPEPARVEISELVSLDGKFLVEFDEPGWFDTTTDEEMDGTAPTNTLEAKKTIINGVGISYENWDLGEVTPESVMDFRVTGGTPPDFIAGAAPLITIAGKPAHGIALDTGINYMYQYNLPAEGGLSPAILFFAPDKAEVDRVLALLDGKITRVG